MKIDAKDFRVPPGAKVALDEWPTSVKPFYKSKKQYGKILERHVAQLSALQRLHAASNRYALLLIFQGMDAAGKDGAIAHVMSGVNPQGCEVFGFKQPSAEDLEHDFLWRTTCRLPERGRIGIFNRRHASTANRSNSPQVAWGDLALDVRTRCVNDRGRGVEFTTTEFDMLSLLLHHSLVGMVEPSVRGEAAQFCQRFANAGVVLPCSWLIRVDLRVRALAASSGHP